MQETTRMPQSSRWSLRQLLLYVFIVCLLFPYLASFYNSLIVDAPFFSIDADEPRQWIHEIDPIAEVYREGFSGNSGGQHSYGEYKLCILTNTTNTKQLMEQLIERVQQKAELEGWKFEPRSIWYEVSKGAAKYIFIVTPEELTHYDELHVSEDFSVTRLKLQLIGFRTP